MYKTWLQMTGVFLLSYTGVFSALAEEDMEHHHGNHDSHHHQDKTKNVTSSYVSNITLEEAVGLTLWDQNKKEYVLNDFSQFRALVLFTHGIGCPIVRHMSQDYANVADKFSDQGVLFFMINANLQDNQQTILADAEKYKISLPILVDDSQQLAKALSLTRTAETILDPSTWAVIYRGPVSDRVSYETIKRQGYTEHLATALNEYVLEGKPVSEPDVRFVGCAISYL